MIAGLPAAPPAISWQRRCRGNYGTIAPVGQHSGATLGPAPLGRGMSGAGGQGNDMPVGWLGTPLATQPHLRVRALGLSGYCQGCMSATLRQGAQAAAVEVKQVKRCQAQSRVPVTQVGAFLSGSA